MGGRRPSAGINGFGRFGLGLFRAWFEDPESVYSIGFINDDFLSIGAIAEVLRHDPVVRTFHDCQIYYGVDRLLVRRGAAPAAEFVVTTGPLEHAAWCGDPDLLFDCSSRAGNYSKYRNLLSGKTRAVLIGASTVAADATLIMGYNEALYAEEHHRIISFGSCTVIPGVHVINAFNQLFGIRSVLVGIVHSVPKWQLESGRWRAPARKACSLEAAAPLLIPSLNPAEIKVWYTYAPYHGVSVMDFAFELSRSTQAKEVSAALRNYVRERRLEHIIGVEDNDPGAESFLRSERSISLVLPSIDVRENRVYVNGFFNNEGSGIRLHELAQTVVAHWGST